MGKSKSTSTTTRVLLKVQAKVGLDLIEQYWKVISGILFAALG